MAYYDDANSSRAELLRVLDAMVSGGRITTADRELARQDIEAAYVEADDASYFGTDARTFWSSLAGRVDAHRASYAAFGGGKRTTGKRSPGESYAETVLSGLTAFDSARATEYASSWRAMWSDVVVQSAQDYATAAQEVGKAATNPWYLWGMAALILGVVVLKSK